MNYVQEKGYLVEKICGSNFSYVLCDNGTFLPTEYKVLQSQVDGCFVKCMKMLNNGNIQLYYVTNSYKSLASLLPNLDPEGFVTIITNLLSDLIDVKHNGFLSCQNVDISFEKIFVEPSTYKVHLVYLPISEKLYGDYSVFENELRINLVKLISDVSTLHSPKVIQLSADLSNGMLTLENLVSHLKLGKSDSRIQNPLNTANSSNRSGEVKLIALNSPNRFELLINKTEFTIGRKADAVDGCIPFNKMIGRVHCRINKNGNQYMITDLQSSNGTYVNKVRLQPNQAFPLSNGDTIRLANSDFQFSVV